MLPLFASSPRIAVSPIPLSGNQRRSQSATLFQQPASRLLVELLRETIERDRFPLSPRIRALKRILDKLEPLPAAPEPFPPPCSPRRHRPRQTIALQHRCPTVRAGRASAGLRPAGCAPYPAATRAPRSGGNLPLGQSEANPP